MVVLPISNMRLTLHQVAAGYFPSLFLNEQDRKYFRPMSEDFATLLQETGYLHIQATKPDTVGELIICISVWGRPELSTQKAWSGLSPTRNPVHLGLWGLSFPSVESQSETLFLFLF